MGDRLVEVPPAVVGDNDGVLSRDVLYEILLRLPAKELCRLRVVCRAWRALTTDPCFVRAFSARNPLLAGLVYTCSFSRNELHVMNLSGEVLKKARITDLRYAGDKLTGMSSGVCVSETLIHACMINPATRHITVLRTNFAMLLDAGSTTFVFGWIPSTREHKVLHIYQPNTGSGGGGGDQKCNVMTLGSKDQRWKSRSSPPMRVLWVPEVRVVIDGVAYFLLYPCSGNERPKDITSFDLATEEWRPVTIRGPLRNLSASADEKIDYWRDLHLAELKGYMVMVHLNYQNSTMDLWFLEDMNKELWTKRYSMRCSPEWGWDEYNSYPLIVLDDGRIIFWEESGGVLRAYDPRTSMWSELAVLKGYCDVGMLQGSLLCSGL